ncbi:solute carrier family 12 member 9-like isoform X2 [Sycon ciliatum]|uniref:solute carrier family 12 member 9-like isoform X2 n=1 Tax=Sycon ciliatum TaxID=27933 RepID=UPI0031F673A3
MAASEKTPLVAASLTNATDAEAAVTLSDSPAQKKKLSTFFGVVVPCVLSIFSVILFLRLGYVVGQAGLWVSLGMLILGYFVVVLTVLSISAICTNGVVQGGGAYFLISRSLGPEFGGSIGVIFYFANIFASALYIIGFVEAFVSSFGPGGEHAVLPGGYGFKFLYGSVVLALCLVVCLLGADLFAKTSFIIFLLVMTSIMAVFISFGTKALQHYNVGEEKYPCSCCYAPPGMYFNMSQPNCTVTPPHVDPECTSQCFYTGWNHTTLKGNLKADYDVDYTTGVKQNFQMVFAVLFNGCTGIMAGANMSGDLKNPSFAIPVGTFISLGFTFVVYVILMFFSAFTVTRDMLLFDYGYLEHINSVPPLVTMGIFAATLSAALSTLIGSSRVLQALAKDGLFGRLLAPFAKLMLAKQEPIPAVLLSWFFVQLILLVGKLNAIAPIVTMFFLISYGVVNFACFALTVASAPNFRPSFRFFTWHTALLGFFGCFVVMFYINALYAAVAVVLLIILFLFISFRSPGVHWGEVSQALIYHQVRKYLLRLDVRKDHVKFWRPQMLLLVANPRSCYRLMSFINDLKKGGLYVLGNVIVSDYDEQSVRWYREQLPTWIDFVDTSRLKAFVELTISPSVRQGVRGLLTTSGLGGMKPNTVVLGYFDHSVPQDLGGDVCNASLHQTGRFQLHSKETIQKLVSVAKKLPALRSEEMPQLLSAEDYVGIIQDSIQLHKNVLVVRNSVRLRTAEEHGTIDLWPAALLPSTRPKRSLSDVISNGASPCSSPSADMMADGSSQPMSDDHYDSTYYMILQLGCVLHMVPYWKSHHRLRIMTVVHDTSERERTTLVDLLKKLRIEAEVQPVTPSGNQQLFLDPAHSHPANSRTWYREMNELMQQHSSAASVVFTVLPPPPAAGAEITTFMENMESLSAGLPPTVMVYGCSTVISTDL